MTRNKKQFVKGCEWNGQKKKQQQLFLYTNPTHTQTLYTYDFTFFWHLTIDVNEYRGSERKTTTTTTINRKYNDDVDV